MNIPKYVKAKMVERSINQTILAERAGLKNQSNLSMMLKTNNMRVDNLFAILEGLDCEMVFRDRITGEEKTITLTD